MSEASFEDLVWLFHCDSRNRGIIRQGFDEAALLWKAVKATNGNILEIGRNHAGSTTLLAAASPGRDLYSIDLAPRHDPACEEFFTSGDNKQRVHLLVADSRKPLPSVPVGFLFIDGDHSFEGVLADVLAHWNALSSGEPLAAFHDALPNGSFVWRERDRRLHHWWVRTKNRFRAQKKEVMARDYEPGVYCVCQQLIDDGVAIEWGRASSMWVLRKLRDLPPDFAERCRTRFDQYSRSSK
ncbi:MAG: class I SAM-dependent methyltransferase [Chthoniobacterales bacterium]